MTKNLPNFFDFLLVILILLAVVCISYLSHRHRTITSASQNFLTIYLDGKQKEIFPLPIGEKIIYHYVKPGFKIEISSFGARVVESDCPRKICSHVGWITLNSIDDTIICVPNKIILKIKNLPSEKKDERYDAIVR